MNLNKLASEVIEAVLHDRFSLLSLIADRLDDEIRGQALCVAATHGRLRIVNLLLVQGTDVRYNCDEPLLNAVEGGHLAIIRVLMRRGAVSTAPALGWAAFNGQDKIVAVLMQSASLDHEQVVTILRYSGSASKEHLGAATLILRWCPRQVLLSVRKWKSGDWGAWNVDSVARLARKEIAWRAR